MDKQIIFSLIVVIKIIIFFAYLQVRKNASSKATNGALSDMLEDLTKITRQNLAWAGFCPADGFDCEVWRHYQTGFPVFFTQDKLHVGQLTEQEYVLSSASLAELHRAHWLWCVSNAGLPLPDRYNPAAAADAANKIALEQLEYYEKRYIKHPSQRD